MNYWHKFLENWTSIKWWVFLIATGLLVFKIIGEYTWAGLAAGIMGVARVFEYYAKKNGNGGENGGK